MVQEANKTPEMPRAPELPPSPEVGKEAAPERAPEQPVRAPEARPAAEVTPTVALPSAVAPTPTVTKDPEMAEIENILAEGLAELYARMSPPDQARFRKKGEETASKIKKLIDSARLKAKSVLQLIKEWLRLIPGVNRFFLEQEAKIKTDRILAYAEKKRGRAIE